ncbi:regulator of Vps4 activity in the MVB pathway-domain-containing protein [Morchella snyderi]|nr:regulator of Vps4 activity in the MVB pathway-domain-containing protein [Morchella snyderi]
MAPPSTTKLKVALKLSVSRLRMTQQRETALAKVNRRQMAQLLEQGKEESARIRVENIIRQDISVELMEILELYCELLLARVQLLEAKECDPGLEEAIKSIIYAAPRTEIKELHQARQLLVEKYGKEFALAAIENTDNKVGDRVLKKLRIEPPSQTLVTLYLKEIARTYNIAWGRTPPSSPPLPPAYNDDDDQPSTAEAVLGGATAAELAPPKTMRGPVNVAPPSPTTENVHPTIKVPGPAAAAVVPAARKTPGAKKNPLDDDDLAARFAALKRL